MLKNHLTIALRSLRKRPGTTLLNVGGLGLGLACCFLIVLFIQHERSFDGFHAHADQVYRLATNALADDEVNALTPAGLAPLIEANLGGVERVIRYANQGAPYLRLPDGEVRKVDGFFLADPGFFDVFSFRFLRGDAATALGDPHHVVLTETEARVLFGEADPLGQTLTLNDDVPLTVAGVVEDLPANTHFEFAVLGSFLLMGDLAGPDALEDMTNWNYRTYVLLDDGAAPDAVAADVAAFAAARFDAEGLVVDLEALPALRFDTETIDYDLATRDPRLLWMFAVVAALILLIACVNFTNLATARATARAREVGVRKSLGAHRGQLVRQFLGESVLLSVLAIGVGIAGAALALPVFNDALGGTAPLDLRHPGTLAVLVALGLAAGLVAGSYPALYLTRFAPARVLKGDLSGNGGSPTLRKGLIVFQFAVSAFLLVAALTVTEQLRFMRSQDLGFAQEQVVTFRPPQEVMGQFASFKQALLADPDVIGVALSSGLPGSVGMSRGYHWPGAEGDEDDVQESFTTVLGDADYLKTVGLELAEGRWFREGEADVDNAYLLNETAVREMGLTDPVGHAFRAWDGDESGVIIGVVKDFHYASLRYAIEPLVLHYKPDWMGNVAVRFAAGAVAPGIGHLQRTFAQAAPGYVLDYQFLDEGFERQVRDEQRLGTLLSFFAGVAVFIACLGIFGLAALAAERRRKEIGVRKVLGASVQSLAALLAGEFVKLVGIAFALAVPLAYLAMSRWLEGFAYAAGLGPGVFLLAGGAVLLVAVLTVSTQALRAAAADPVKALRYE